MIRVAIADDHVLLLDGLRQALDAIPDIEVVGVASDGAQLLELAEQVHPDVVILDLEMPNVGGLEALRRLTPAVPTLVVTMHADDAHRSAARQAGANGFFSKSIPLPDLAAAIRAAAAGAELEPDELADTLAAHRQPLLDEGAAALTPREREVLELLASGVSGTDELGARLFISTKTVKNHLASIYEKLAVSDRAQAAVEAIRLGIAK